MIMNRDLEKLAKTIATIKDLAVRQMAASVIGAVCSEGNRHFNWDRWNRFCRIEQV